MINNGNNQSNFKRASGGNKFGSGKLQGASGRNKFGSGKLQGAGYNNPHSSKTSQEKKGEIEEDLKVIVKDNTTEITLDYKEDTQVVAPPAEKAPKPRVEGARGLSIPEPKVDPNLNKDSKPEDDGFRELDSFNIGKFNVEAGEGIVLSQSEDGVMISLDDGGGDVPIDDPAIGSSSTVNLPWRTTISYDEDNNTQLSVLGGYISRGIIDTTPFKVLDKEITAGDKAWLKITSSSGTDIDEAEIMVGTEWPSPMVTALDVTLPASVLEVNVMLAEVKVESDVDVLIQYENSNFSLRYVAVSQGIILYPR